MLDVAITGMIGLWATNTTLPSYTIDMDQVDGWFRVAGEILIVVGAVWQVRKRADKKTAEKQAEVAAQAALERQEMEDRLVEKLEQRTQPIQPLYRNGGESLADIANEVKRQREVLTETNRVLTSVHKIAAETSVELSLHRESTRSQFEAIGVERSAILAAAAAQTSEWRVALTQQGITVPNEEETP